MVEKALFDDLFGLFGDKGEVCNRAVVRQIFLIERRFFNSGLIIDDFKMEGKVPVVMERITIERIVGDIVLEIFFSTVVGTGSRSQYKLMIERVDFRFRVRWQERKSGVEEG